MKEVEILVKVDGNKEKILKFLKSKFNFKKTDNTTDIYFYDKKTNRFHISKNGRLEECFRLRRKENLNSKNKDERIKTFITYKKDIFDKKGIWLYSDEFESEIQDYDAILLLIKKLGYDILGIVKIEKHIFKSEDYEIVLEDVDKLGLFMEVEKLIEDNKKVGNTKKEIRKFISALKLKCKELNTGKLELLLKKKKSE